MQPARHLSLRKPRLEVKRVIVHLPRGQDNLAPASTKFRACMELEKAFSEKQILLPGDTSILRLLYKSSGCCARLRPPSLPKSTGPLSPSALLRTQSQRNLLLEQNKENFISPTSQKQKLKKPAAGPLENHMSLVPTTGLSFSKIREEVKRHVSTNRRRSRRPGCDKEETRLKALTLHGIIEGLVQSAVHRRLLQWHYRSCGTAAVRARNVRDGMAALEENLRRALLRRTLMKLFFFAKWKCDYRAM